MSNGTSKGNSKGSDKIAEILARLDIQREYEEGGLRIPASARPTNKGWIACHSILRDKDDSPSAGIFIGKGGHRGVYKDFGSTGKAPYSCSFFAALVHLGRFNSVREAIIHFARKCGVQFRASKPPSSEDVKTLSAQLKKTDIEYFKTKRGLNEESIKKYCLGYCKKRDRYSIPVYDDKGNLVNIRYHNSTKKPKTINTSGFGTARLWGVDRLTQAPEGSVVCVTEGEYDSMACEQTTGFVSVSPTNGYKSFSPDWIKFFHGKNVVLVWDCDQEGREAVQNLILPLFQESVLTGKVRSIKAFWLYEGQSKGTKDFTDWIVKSKGTKEKFHEQLKDTPNHIFKSLVQFADDSDPIRIAALSEIGSERYSNKKVSVVAQNIGETTALYAVPTKVKVTECPMTGRCTGPDGKPGQCIASEGITIPISDRILLAAIKSSDSSMRRAIKEYVCDKIRKPEITWDTKDVLPIREVDVQDVMDGSSQEVTAEAKKVYVIGHRPIPVGLHEFTGFVVSNPKNQQPTIIAKATPVQEDYKTFKLDKQIQHLNTLRELGVNRIIADLSSNVTGILERDELHLFTLLTMCSPLWIETVEGIIRGWLAGAIVGDTGTGKTSVYSGIMQYADIGVVASGSNTRRTGLVYAVVQNRHGEWYVQIGIYPRYSGQMLCLDEGQDVEMKELKSVADALSSKGLMRVDMAGCRIMEAKTRLAIICNPVDPRNRANQRQMDEFRFGCESLRDIFPKMLIRRMDYALFVTSHDIEDKNRIYFPKGRVDSVVTPEMIRALTYYAWNLEPHQIVLDDSTYKAILREAKKLSDVYGKCEDLPIVFPEDFRQNFTRMVVAYAVLSLSSDDNFRTIYVTDQHAKDMFRILDRIYSNTNCSLNLYSEFYGKTHYVSNDFNEILSELEKEKIKNANVWSIFNFMFNEKSAKSDSIEDIIGRSNREARESMVIFRRLGLVTSNRNGYHISSKFIRFANKLFSDKPEFKMDMLEYGGLDTEEGEDI